MAVFRTKLIWAIAACSVVATVVLAALSIPSPSRGKPAETTITVTGLVYHNVTVNLEDLMSRESVTVTAELICVSGISSGTHNWTGVRLSSLIADAGVRSDVIKVAFTASDHYTTDLTLEDAIMEGVIIAYLQDGSPLAEKTRLVVPNKWGYKWISDLVTVELVDYDFLGKWERRGYSDDATIPA